MTELIPDKNWDRIATYTIQTENDIVTARQYIRFHAKQNGMGIVDQTRITTAVSELFRNMYQYAGGGEVYVDLGEFTGHRALIITCVDEGPGIENLELAMNDGYTSGVGMGYGLPGAKRLVDEFSIESKVNKGTKVRVMKWI
ncbi:MAG: anti-sigma regulatory factor [Bacteroidetes bacterium]|nr:anti-sigma regulatory factor [Bacteroidota bacterium]